MESYFAADPYSTDERIIKFEVVCQRVDYKSGSY